MLRNGGWMPSHGRDPVCLPVDMGEKKEGSMYRQKTADRQVLRNEILTHTVSPNICLYTICIVRVLFCVRRI